MGTKQAENVEWKLGIQIDEYRVYGGNGLFLGNEEAERKSRLPWYKGFYMVLLEGSIPYLQVEGPGFKVRSCSPNEGGSA